MFDSFKDTLRKVGVQHSLFYGMSKLFLTELQAFFLNPSLSSLHILAASTFAGDSVLGSASMDITLGTREGKLVIKDYNSVQL